MNSKWTSSRRDVLQTLVMSALLSAAPISVLEAATKNGHPSVITLTDGSRLVINKVGDKQFTATREEGDKVIDEKPTGSFEGRKGQVIVVDEGKVMSVKSTTGARESDGWFAAFWQ